MKKIFYLSIVSAFVLVLTACNSSSSGELFSKTTTEKYNELSYAVPTEFEKVDTEDDVDSETLKFSNYYYSFTKKGANGKYDDACMLSFSYGTSIRENDTVKDYALIFEDDNKATSTTKTINGVEWLIYKEEEASNMIQYRYYAKNGKNYYTITYNDDGSGNLCGDALKIIENSFKFN